MKNKKTAHYYYKLGIILTLVLSLCGCYSLRKKFIREKKQPQEEQIYVDFKKYPQVASTEMYSDYYVFINGWLDQLIETITLDEIPNYKREKRAATEALRIMDRMMEILDSAGRQKLQPLCDELSEVEKMITSDSTDVDRTIILRKTDWVRIRFQRDFTYSKVRKWLK
ncbi:MAG: hypothetical protein ABH858_00595 [Candidatus Omnitrophota bacterium]